MTDERKELASAERRNFLKLMGTGGFTAAMVARRCWRAVVL